MEEKSSLTETDLSSMKIEPETKPVMPPAIDANRFGYLQIGMLRYILLCVAVWAQAATIIITWELWEIRSTPPQSSNSGVTTNFIWNLSVGFIGRATHRSFARICSPCCGDGRCLFARSIPNAAPMPGQHCPDVSDARPARPTDLLLVPGCHVVLGRFAQSNIKPLVRPRQFLHFHSCGHQPRRRLAMACVIRLGSCCS